MQAQPLASATVAALPGINFITGQQTVKHLGVRLGYDMRAACQQTFTGIYHAISARIRHWAARGLNACLGRVHCLHGPDRTDRLGAPYLGRCSSTNQLRLASPAASLLSELMSIRQVAPAAPTLQKNKPQNNVWGAVHILLSPPPPSAAASYDNQPAAIAANLSCGCIFALAGRW